MLIQSYDFYSYIFNNKRPTSNIATKIKFKHLRKMFLDKAGIFNNSFDKLKNIFYVEKEMV